MARVITIGGLTLPGSTLGGAQFRAVNIEGWAGSPGSTVEVTQRRRAHGALLSPDVFLRARYMQLSGAVSGPTAGIVRDAVDALKAAVSLAPTEMSVDEHGLTRVAMVSRVGEVAVQDEPTPLYKQFRVQIVAPDPRKYAPLVARSTGLPSASGGLTWPVTWPVTWSGVTTSGTVSITNAGNIAGPVQVIFDGPVTDPAVTHVQSQATVRLSGLTLASGQFLTVDMDRREVLEQGQSSRNGYITSRGWCELAPGANDFAFSAGSYDAGAAMTVTAPEGAWL